MINPAIEERRLRIGRQVGCGTISVLAGQLTEYIHDHIETDEKGFRVYVGDPSIVFKCKKCYDYLEEHALDK